MEVFRITLLSLLVYMAYVPYAVQARDPIYGKVGEKITLPCPSYDKDTSLIQTWNRGKHDTNIPPEQLIYRVTSASKKEGPMHRPDMTFDENTFAMTLTVTVENGISDNDYFTCMKQGIQEDTVDVQEVRIFLQPVVTIKTDRQPEEGVNVTVSCSVEHLYPNITSDQFTMRWNNQAAVEPEFTGIENEEGSMKYTLEKMKNLTRDDDGATVECTVTPDTGFGEVDIASLVLNFTAGPTDSPAGGSNIGATIGRVISGLAAVAIIVAIRDSTII